MKAADTSQFFANSGHLSEEGVSLYVDALKLGRNEELPGVLLEHVRDCMRCKEEITGLYFLVTREDYSDAGPHPYFDAERPPREADRFRIFKIAASVVAVLAAAALIYIAVDRHATVRPDRPDLAALPPADTADAPAHPVPEETPPLSRRDDLLAARFVESPELEDLLRSPARSAETEIATPANGSRVRTGTLFRWRTTAEPPYEITVVNNQKRTVLTFQIDSSGFVWRDSLPKGLYYWKLGGDGSLLHVGKFVIR